MRKHPGPSVPHSTPRPTQTSRLLTSGETGGGEEDSRGVHDGFGLGLFKKRESREESVCEEKNSRAALLLLLYLCSPRVRCAGPEQNRQYLAPLPAPFTSLVALSLLIPGCCLLGGLVCLVPVRLECLCQAADQRSKTCQPSSAIHERKQIRRVQPPPRAPIGQFR